MTDIDALANTVREQLEIFAHFPGTLDESEALQAGFAALDALTARAKQAEADLAIEREHNPHRVYCPQCSANLPCESCARYHDLREELEAEVERLTAALRGIAEADPRLPNGYEGCRRAAREALAGKEVTNEHSANL